MHLFSDMCALAHLVVGIRRQEASKTVVLGAALLAAALANLKGSCRRHRFRLWNLARRDKGHEKPCLQSKSLRVADPEFEFLSESEQFKKNLLKNRSSVWRSNPRPEARWHCDFAHGKRDREGEREGERRVRACVHACVKASVSECSQKKCLHTHVVHIYTDIYNVYTYVYTHQTYVRSFTHSFDS